MKWALVMALPVMMVACDGAEAEQDESQETQAPIVQSKEERQAEIAQMEQEIAGMAKRERTPMMDEKADLLLKRYRDYVIMNPRDSISAEYLFKAADLSLGVGRPEASINLLNRLNEDFPKFRKNVEMWLFKGFIYETYLNDYANATQTYQALIDRYPNHRLAADARASIENMTMSEEELLEKFKAKNEAK
jgi:TolA-binding protein